VLTTSGTYPWLFVTHSGSYSKKKTLKSVHEGKHIRFFSLNIFLFAKYNK